MAQRVVVAPDVTMHSSPLLLAGVAPVTLSLLPLARANAVAVDRAVVVDVEAVSVAALVMQDHELVAARKVSQAVEVRNVDVAAGRRRRRAAHRNEQAAATAADLHQLVALVAAE